MATSIKIESKPNGAPDSAYVLDSTLGGTVSSYLDEGLQAATGYTYRVTRVIDGTASVPVIVSATTLTAAPANVAPVANAGTDNTITLPTNSVTLTGSGTDSDGTVASYLWAKVSGTGGTITTPNAATTTVTGLTQGTYEFRLTVTDDDGATHQDTVQVTVNAAAAPAPAPTDGVVDDTANTFNWSHSPAYISVSDYEMTFDGGVTVADVTEKPIFVDNLPKAAGKVGVRVKAGNGRLASAWLFNAAPFTAYSYPAEPTLLSPETIAARFNAKGATVDENNAITAVTSDYNGNSFTLAPLSIAKAPAFVPNALLGNTMPVMRFTAANQTALIGGDILDQRMQEFTIFVLAKPSGGASYQGIATKGAQTNATGCYGIGYDVDGYRINNASVNGGAYVNYKATRPANNYDVIAFTQVRPAGTSNFNGTLKKFLNKTLISTGYGQELGYDMDSLRRFILGANDTGTGEASYFDGDIVDILIHRKTFSDTEVGTQTDKLQSIWGFGSYFVPSGSNVGEAKVMAIGDSLTNAYGSTNGLATKLNPAKFQESSIVYHGMSGYRTDQLLPLYDGWLRSDYDPTTSRNIAVFMAGTNDLNQGVAPSVIQANLTTMTTQAKKRGWKVIVMVPPELLRNEDGTTSKPDYVTYKNWILANYQTVLKADGLVNLYADPKIGGYNTTYADHWNPDRLHLSTLGYGVLEDLLKPKLEAVEAVLSVIPPAPTNPVTDDANNTFTVTTTQATSNLEYTLDKGVTFNNVTQLPIPLGNIIKPVGDVGVRVKALNGNPPSAWTFNTVAFTGSALPEEFVPFSDSRWSYHGAWDLGQPTYAFTGSGPAGGDNKTAKITFTKGIKIVHNSNYAGVTARIYIDGVQHSDVPITGNGQVVFDYHPDTDTPKLFEIGLVTTQAYLTLGGATLYA